MTQTALQSLHGVMTQIAPVPPGIDPARLVLWETRGKFSYEYVRSVIGATLQSLNEERAIAFGDAIALTVDQAVWYMNGGSVEPANITMGKTRPQLVRGNNAGHMIDLIVWSLGFGGDPRTLSDMTESQLIGGVVSLATSLRDRFDYSIFWRALTNTEVALGTSGYSVGFCDGSPNAGSGGPSYAPPKWNGKTFYEDHNHYLAYNLSTPKTFADCLDGVASTVAEHGLPLNTDFKVYVSEADVASYRALANYVMPITNVSLDRGGLTSGNIFYEQGSVGSIPQSGGRYIGSYNTAYGFAQLYATPRIPTGYGWMYRPGPAFAANNALAVRYRPEIGFGVRINEIPDYSTTFPIREIDAEDEYGVSAGKNRYAGACYFLGAGATTYVNPTIAL
jgi:hypothetical protein